MPKFESQLETIHEGKEHDEFFKKHDEFFKNIFLEKIQDKHSKDNKKYIPELIEYINKKITLTYDNKVALSSYFDWEIPHVLIGFDGLKVDNFVITPILTEYLKNCDFTQSEKGNIVLDYWPRVYSIQEQGLTQERKEIDRELKLEELKLEEVIATPTKWIKLWENDKPWMAYWMIVWMENLFKDDFDLTGFKKKFIFECILPCFYSDAKTSGLLCYDLFFSPCRIQSTDDSTKPTEIDVQKEDVDSDDLQNKWNENLKLLKDADKKQIKDFFLKKIDKSKQNKDTDLTWISKSMVKNLVRAKEMTEILKTHNSIHKPSIIGTFNRMFMFSKPGGKKQKTKNKKQKTNKKRKTNKTK